MTNKEAYKIISQYFYNNFCPHCEKAHCLDTTIGRVFLDCKAPCAYSEALCKLKECVEECEDREFHDILDRERAEWQDLL